jgi:hypothetical protein
MAGRSRSTRTGEPPSKFNPTENAVQRTRAFTGLWVVVAGDVAIASAAIYGVIRSGTAQNATQIVAILTSAFTAVGTMTTAYFGIRAASNTAQAATADAAQTATAQAEAARPNSNPNATGTGGPATGTGGPATGTGGGTEAHLDTGELTETNASMPEEEITAYDGATELDQEGDPQPVADAPEDDDPAALAGEELPDEEEAP